MILTVALLFLSLPLLSCAPGEQTPQSQEQAEPRNLPPPADGTLIVLNKAEATANLFDLRTGRIVATLPTGGGPHEAAVSPSGKVAVACNYGAQQPGSTLTLIDVSTAKITKTINLGEYRRPHGVEFLSEDRLVVTCEGNRAVVIVNLASGKVESAIETAQEVSHMIATTPDGKRAFVANIGSGTVTALDLIEGKKLRDIPTGAGAEGIAVSPDGKEVWVTNRSADTVSIVAADSLEVIKTLESPEFPIRVKITPDGKRALVSNARSATVTVFDAKTKERLGLVEMRVAAADSEGRLFGGQFGSSSVPIGILIHPSGKWAYVANANADLITVLDVEAMKIVGYLATGREPDGMAFSPVSVKPGG